LTIQNTLRRIFGNYFKILGGVDPEKICGMSEGKERLICKSLFSWVNQGLHSMAMIERIRAKLEKRQYEFSKHAVDQSIIRDISVAEVEDAIGSPSKIIEDYPDDKYGPSCLILGCTKAGRPLHVQCSYPSRQLVKIITLYEPDPDLWIDFRVRR
jgi:hypothetical protein